MRDLTDTFGMGEMESAARVIVAKADHSRSPAIVFRVDEFQGESALTGLVHLALRGYIESTHINGEFSASPSFWACVGGIPKVVA